MKRHWIGFVIAVLVGSWMAASPGAGTEEEAMAVFPMSDKEHTCVEVQVGQAFSLKFVTSPGTGFGWELAAPLDEKMLVLVEKKTMPSERGLLGAGEHEIWIFRALAAGRTEIALKYARPWEKDIAPLKMHSFKVRIR